MIHQDVRDLSLEAGEGSEWYLKFAGLMHGLLPTTSPIVLYKIKVLRFPNVFE